MAVVRAALVAAALVLLAGPEARGASCGAPRRACVAASAEAARACRSLCARRPSPGCTEACAAARVDARTRCAAVDVSCAALCAPLEPRACADVVRRCRADARVRYAACARGCSTTSVGGEAGCRERCRLARARDEAGCGYEAVATVVGAPVLPDRPVGRAADPSLLDDAERAVVAAADARAAALRTRPLRLVLGRPGVPVRVTQRRHGFPFGFPIDLRRFASADDRDWYARTMADHFGLVVVENTLKWRAIEAQEGMRTYADGDADVAWGEALGVPVKGHTLLWGVVPPFSSSGVPPWALTRFAALPLSPADAAALREIVRRHVVDLVGRYRGRLSIWDASNETLQPLGQWFVERLGPGIVDDVFRWAHEADPDAQLVFNEWIVEVFTGFPQPTAATVRDRVRALRAAGVPVHAIGQQAHFVPAAAFAGVPVDLSGRTRLDTYAAALDTLAEAGVPVHVTETNVIAPDDPERRAAQFEGLLRIWWGHPAVEQVVFWGPWNAVAGRDEFDVGLWDDARVLSRHGEAVLSLLNDRWRTRVDAVTDADGVVELSATHGEYVAEWLDGTSPVYATFRVEPGAGTARVVVLPR